MRRRERYSHSPFSKVDSLSLEHRFGVRWGYRGEDEMDLDGLLVFLENEFELGKTKCLQMATARYLLLWVCCGTAT
jgi:hypothetical protein